MSEPAPVIESPVHEPAARRPARRTRSRAKVALAIVAVVIVAGVALAPFVVHAIVTREARARGVELSAFSLDLGLSRVALRDVRFTLAGVPGARGSAARAAVDLDGLEPRAVGLDGLAIELADPRAVLALAAWEHAHGARAIPVTAKAFTIRLASASGAPALASLSGDLTANGRGGTLDGARLEVLGRSLGPASVSFRFESGRASLDIARPGSPARSALSLTLDARATPARLHVALAPIATGEVAAALGLTTKLAADVEATLDAPIPDLAAGAPVEATVDATLTGFVPPHPKELDGIVFGDRTVVHAKLRAADLAKADLSDVRVAAGALALTGTGTLTPSSGGARVRLDLAGALPCAQLATSAAAAHLPAWLAASAGNLARQALGGSVSVRLFIDADSRNPAAARVDPSAIVRCRLGP